MVKKKKIIIFLIVILLLVAGGVFWWWQGREIKGSPEDYVIKETAEGKIVENKKAGLIVKIPEGWKEQKIESLEGSVAFDTQDIEGKWEEGMVKPPLKKGCTIEIAVVYKKMKFDEIKEEIKRIHFILGIKSEEFEEVIINNQPALKNIFDTELIGPGIATYFTQKNKLYSFVVYWAPDEKERCFSEFDKFLETVLID